MSDVEIGRSKRARVAYSFDDVSLVPSRRTRDDELVSLNCCLLYTSDAADD
jgi:IMP dehydrogenase